MTLQRAVMALRHQQHADGHWCAVLEGDSILESEYLLMKFILGQEQEPMADGRGPEVLDRIAEGLRRQQRPDGSWGQYPGSGIDVSATVKAYFALKLMGDTLEAPHMSRAPRAGARPWRRRAMQLIQQLLPGESWTGVVECRSGHSP